MHYDVGAVLSCVLLREFRDFRDVVYRADFVVGEHDTDDSVAVTESRAHVVGIDDTVAIYGHGYDVVSIFFELLGGVDDGVMLDLGDDDVA